MTLNDLLQRRDRLSWQERQVLARCTPHAFCVPQAEPLPGRAPVVSVRDGRGALWCLELEAPAPGRTPFVNHAARSAELATRLVMIEVGGVRPELLGRPLAMAAQLMCDTAPTPTPPVLDGGSFGLSMALAVMSYVLRTPLDATVAASAALAPDGALLPVDGLGEKLRTLRDWAPRVKTVLVATDQEVAEVAGGPRVQTVSSIEAALDIVFEDAPLAALLIGQLTPDERPRLARDLFRLALLNTPHMLSWRTVKDVSEQLAGQLWQDAPDGLAVWHARAAGAIAARHLGQTGIPMPAAEPRDLPAALRLELLAHRVQQAADLGEPAWRALAERARATALEEAGHAATNKLWGALGRLHAAWGEAEAALDALERAWQGWQGLLQEDQASHALCEWLRVLGAADRGADVDRLLAGPYRIVWDHPATAEVSRSFLALAAGRALMWTGRSDRALEQLEPRPATYVHAELARLRLRLQIRDDATERAALDASAQARCLLRLAQGEAAALAELAADPDKGGEVQRILSFNKADAEPCAFVSRWWRY